MCVSFTCTNPSLSTHPPPLSLSLSSEFKPPAEVEKEALISKNAKAAGFRAPQIKISRGTVVYTRDNSELDEVCLLNSSEHEIWNGTASDNKQQSQLLELLSKHAELQKKAKTPETPGSAVESMASRQGARKGGISLQGSTSIAPTPPGSASVVTGVSLGTEKGSGCAVGSGVGIGASVAA